MHRPLILAAVTLAAFAAAPLRGESDPASVGRDPELTREASWSPPAVEDVRARLDGVQREAIDALALLPGRERVAFCMVRLDDAPLADVAQVLGCSVPTACKLVQRAEAILGRAGWGASSSSSAVMPASSVSAHKAVAHG